ncbi:hypothetical protein NENIHHPF_00014 [Enterococcus phage EF_FB]
MIIRFQGKDLNLRLTYKSIHFLELAFDQDYASFIAEQNTFQPVVIHLLGYASERG